RIPNNQQEIFDTLFENEEIHFEVFRNFNSKRKKEFKEEIDSIDYRRCEMKFLFSEYYHVFGKSNPLSQYDLSCIGRILKPKKKIQLKHVKKVVEDDLEEGVQVKNGIRYVAGNAGITRAAFKYCKCKCIFILEVLKTTDD
ncbi:17344_t:CDS:2, partial [Racocetra persica]